MPGFAGMNASVADGGAGALAALHLPTSPAGVVALLLVALVVTYVLLSLFIRTEVPHNAARPAPDDDPEPDAEDDTDDAGDTDGDPAPEEDPEWRYPVGAPPPPQPPVLAVEAVRYRGFPLRVGDDAGTVMRAFRPGEGEMAPLVERGSDGVASQVTRAYAVDGRLLTLTFERLDAREPLRLARITFGPDV